LAAVSLFQEETARDATITRFRHLLARHSAEAFLDRLADRLGALLHRDAALAAWRRRAPLSMGHVGVGMARQTGLAFVGAQAPLARLSARMLAGIAGIAEALGAGGIRLTPWHGVVIPGVAQERAAEVAEALEALGLVCGRRNPLAAIVACAGTAGCAASYADTKADALEIARRLAASAAPRHSVHLSGCAKSCASARVADATLVATAPGRYELFLKTHGEAGTGGKFGLSIARDLSASEAGERLLGAFATPASGPGKGRG
jgi:precorrin-3B synthase